MPEEEKPQLCKDCPLAPPGVAVALEYADTVRAGEINRFRFAHDAPELADHFIGRTRIHVTAVESADPNVDTGDEANMMLSGDIDPQVVAERISACHGSKWSWRHISRVCGALGPQLRRSA